MRLTTLAIACLALAASTGAASAQPVRASLDSSGYKTIGSWQITCRVDAISDRRSCTSWLPLLGASRVAGGIQAYDAEDGIAPMLFARSGEYQSAWIRVDKDPAWQVQCINSPVRIFSTVCLFDEVKSKRLVDAMAAGQRLVVRFVGRTEEVDGSADLAETRVALDEFVRLRRAAGIPAEPRG